MVKTERCIAHIVYAEIWDESHQNGRWLCLRKFSIYEDQEGLMRIDTFETELKEPQSSVEFDL